jgi:hypothetical protein
VSYIITTHRGLAGVRLSKAGEWGNVPYPDEQAAREAARKHAGNRPVAIEVQALRAPVPISA